MGYEAYVEINLRNDSRQLIALINRIIDSYIAQGFKLSVRQLYYQLVARDLIPNTEQSYKRVASIINDGRLAGLIDWDAIEDRNRDIDVRARWDSGASIVQAAADSFHMDMWDNQRHRLFVIVEKAALEGILSSVCRRYDVPILAARGYPSVTVVREMALDHLQEAIQFGQTPIVLHFGDHDPSGIDMTRDLRERFDLFLGEEDSSNYELIRCALNMPQIEEVQPPPNPAKTTDSRFKEYRRKFGDESWELDALEPNYLVNLVTGHITDYIDQDSWDEREAEIEAIRERLKYTAREFRKAD